MKKQRIVFIIAIIISIIYIIIGNRIALKNNKFFNDALKLQYPRAKITRVIERKETPIEIGELSNQYNTDIIFEARMLSGKDKGSSVIAMQNISTYVTGTIDEVKAGDEILLYNNENTNGSSINWYFVEYSRTKALIVLGLIFLGLILLFGKTKGVKTIVALLITCLAIFVVYIPAILGGQNIYAWTIVTCAFITFSTVMIVYGYSKKTLSTSFGCIGGVLVAGLLTLIMNGFLKLTGFVDENAIYLMQLNEAIDLKAIIFGGILIGAIGAIMDVSIDISSSLFEVADNMEKPDFKSIMKSGFNIGKDIMGTMTNTLILAYIGSSLSEVLLLTASNNSLSRVFNLEMIVVEILQALVGSVGLLTTIPLTSLACAVLYKQEEKRTIAYNAKK